MPLLQFLIPIAKQVATWLIPYVIQKKVEEYFKKKEAEKKEQAKTVSTSPDEQ